MDLSGLTLLVLEDEPIIAIALEDLLLDAGAQPLVASSNTAAERIVKARDVDAAVLDVNLGPEKSYPLAQVLHARGIPFIFATGYGDALHPQELAAVPTIAKPYSLDEIAGALGTACPRLNSP